MATIAMYFGKVNLISSDINSVLYNNGSLYEIIQNVISALSDGTTFKDCRPIKIENEMTFEEIEYSLAIKEKNMSNIHGYIYKKSFIHYKAFNEDTKELDSKKISNTEGIVFYYNALREMIAYQRSQRFGYKEILTAFEGIMNNACKNANLTYKFSLSQFTEGIDLDELKKDLKNEGPVQKINIKYQIPNPDAELLEAIRKNKEKTISEFEDANLTTKNVIYLSNSEKGIKIESELIEHELENIENMHSQIDAKKATQNGYVVVETTYVNGLTRSSADMRPLVKHINENSDFGLEAENTIASRVAHEIKINQ